MSCKVVITQDHEGRRLDRTIRSIWPALPLSAIMRGLRKGEVRLDAVCAKQPDTRVRCGQELYVPWEEPDSDRNSVRNWGPVPLIWHGENTLVVNKPPNLLVQPDVKGGDSVITRVWGMLGAAAKSLGFSPAAVHRLDRNTTGALVVALSGEALRELERLFKERLVTKRYLAVVVGKMRGKGLIDAPLVKDEVNNIVHVRGDGKTASTRYQFLDGDEELSLISIELLTGRTHQARVHTAHVGHPILGDRKYGDIETNRRWKIKAGRPLLHAFELGFPTELPRVLAEVAGKTFRAELPEDMRAILKTRGWSVDL